MSKLFDILLIISCMFTGCTSEDYISGRGTVPPPETVLTLVTSFGDDDSLKDFLLAQPGGLCVNHTDDIFVENHIS